MTSEGGRLGFTPVIGREATYDGNVECEACGSHAIVRVIYGYPGADLLRAAVTGTVVLGGCELSLLRKDPNTACRDCGNRWFVEQVQRDD
jgi:DNA-directed RNA polymerase subunit RPC12/RpoP